MKLYDILALCAIAVAAASCQEKDVEIAAPQLEAPAPGEITGELIGNDYVWTWPATDPTPMQVTVYTGPNMFARETVDGNSYTHTGIDTNIEYTYVFKRTDGRAYSPGVVKTYTRHGADRITGIMMRQLDRAGGGYDAAVEWTNPANASAVTITATNGSRTENATFTSGESSYTIASVDYGEEWTVTLTATNDEGASLPSSSTLRIGKTAVGFLSAYPTPQELIAHGDDDEASAWLWFHSEYPTGSYIYFGDITSQSDIDPYRVLFWLRDLEDVGEDAVWTWPEPVENATEHIIAWYKAGGNLLLWSHATAYIGRLGRIDQNMMRTNDRAIGTGHGGWNGDTWAMAVQLHPGSRFKKDASTHPIFKGLEVTETDRTKLISFKGPGWTEDHNCLYFNLPSVITGIGNQEEACYTAITEQYGIIPLGTWDSQIDWVSQLNVWEAQQGDTDFAGTVLCIGNGGCEFSMRNADGSADISAYPSNNIYQENVLTLARNSIEYLKTR